MKNKPDGTKASVIGDDRNGFDYLGSLVYTNNNNTRTLESTSFGGGRINKTYRTYDINYFITDHLGSTRVIVDNNGEIKEQKDYYPFGKEHENPDYISSTNRWGYNGKEKQTVRGLNFLDYGARMFDDFLGRWFTQDLLQEKFYGWSSYNYCMNNPLKFIDTDGKQPRIYVETKGFGHAFVTVGERDKTIVYTYGRYGDLGKDKSSSRGTTPNGEGVLIRLTGDEAKAFIQDQLSRNEASVFEFTKGSDETVMEYFDEKFNNSDKIPETGIYANNENARVIDEYNLLTNNCVTTSIEGVQSGVEKDLKLDGLKGPMALRDALYGNSWKKMVI